MSMKERATQWPSQSRDKEAGKKDGITTARGVPFDWCFRCVEDGTFVAAVEEFE